MQNRLEQLESLARAAFDALVSVDDWVGSAGTRQAATDALRRLETKLTAAGFECPTRNNLEFRGAILDDLERMGLRYDCRDDELRFSVPDEPCCYASGPRLADVLAAFRDVSPDPDIDGPLKSDGKESQPTVDLARRFINNPAPTISKATPKQKVFVTVQGGVAEVCEDTLPESIEVEIFDFDNLADDAESEMRRWSSEQQDYWLANHKAWGRCGSSCPWASGHGRKASS